MQAAITALAPQPLYNLWFQLIAHNFANFWDQLFLIWWPALGDVCQTEVKFLTLSELLSDTTPIPLRQKRKAHFHPQPQQLDVSVGHYSSNPSKYILSLPWVLSHSSQLKEWMTSFSLLLVLKLSFSLIVDSCVSEMEISGVCIQLCTSFVWRDCYGEHKELLTFIALSQANSSQFSQSIQTGKPMFRAELGAATLGGNHSLGRLWYYVKAK